jgi:hypothetical protein
MTTFEFTPRLAEDVKAEWIAALESGDYEQGQGALALVTDEGKRTYCCLGVLCEVLASSERVSLPVSIDEQESRYVKYDGSSTSLPVSVQRYASLPGYPTVSIPDEPWKFIKASATVRFRREQALDDHRNQTGDVSLAELNDAGVPFTVIAEVIRQYM